MARVSPSAVVLLIIVFLLLYSPGPDSKDVARRPPEGVTWMREGEALNVLRNHSWEDFNIAEHTSAQSIPLPGFRPDDGFNWHLSPLVYEKVIVQMATPTMGQAVPVNLGRHNGSMLLYQNVTGWVRGGWRRVGLSEMTKSGIRVNETVNRTSTDARVAQTGRSLTHNITGYEGKMQVRLIEHAHKQTDELASPFNIIDVRLELQDASSYADGWAWNMHGLHHKNSGSILVSTTSETFAGIFALPHFQLISYGFNESRRVLDAHINRTIQQQGDRNVGSNYNPWGEARSEDSSVPKAPSCELMAWLQQYRLPVHAKTSEHFEDNAAATQGAREKFAALEEELRHPVGLWSAPPPPLHFTATMFSPDCGYLLTSKGPPNVSPAEAQHLLGLFWTVRVGQARSAMVLLMLVLVGQMLLVIDQIGAAATPSKKSRISFWTLIMLSLGDGFVAFGFLFLSSVTAMLYTTSLMVAFLAFMQGLFFAMRFILEVWNVQEPERTEQARTRQRRSSQPPPLATGPASASQAPQAATDTGASPLPIPITQTPAVTATVNLSTGTTFGAIYTRYCLFLLTVVFISIWAASSWPVTLRNIYANSLGLAYFSFWIPQIYRNVMRNSRIALTRRFIIGESALRLLPFAYCWGYQDNVLFFETSRPMLAAFAIWLWIQIVVLTGQEIIGPRFFILENATWLPAAWNYHPILREDEEGATMPVGYDPNSPESPTDERRPSLDSTSRSEKKGKRSFDCAICMQRIEVPVVPAGESPPSGNSASDVLTGGFMARRHYSVTPCRHIFHSACLESSLNYRMSCPVCREHLPPL